MRMTEWNTLLAYANTLCHEASEETGVKIDYSPYSMYDGRKGIKIIVFDCNGEEFASYTSGTGINNDYDEVKTGVLRAIERIKAVI
jgi:hypothetical protein